MFKADKLKGGVIVVLLLGVLAVFDNYYNADNQNGEITGAAISKQCYMDLANYPCQFARNGKFDGVIVIGDKTDSYGIAASGIIATGLKHGDRITAPPPKRASEVTDSFAQNVISVGLGCSNTVTYDIQSKFGQVSKKRCWNSALTKEGQGSITLYDFGNGKSGLVVEGYTEADVKRAAGVLRGYKDWQGAGQLKGKGVLVTQNSAGGTKIIPIKG